MKVLIVDHTGLNLSFALEAQREGHDVRLYSPQALKGQPNHAGRGLVQRMRDWEPSMGWADLVVVSDNSKGMYELDRYRRRGYPIFGSTRETAEWELNRARGQEVLQSAGVSVADSHRFNSFKKAAAFAASSGKRYVAKPNGDVDKALSYVPKGQDDLAFMLDRWDRTHKGNADFVLQEFIPGTEFAVGGFFGPAGWVGPWLENFEHKKLMAGDSGPNTGEMGTVMKYVTDSKLAEEMLIPLEGELYRQGYTGYIDVAVIIDERGRPWPLEFTCRFGYPLWPIQQVLHPRKVEWMADLVVGRDSFKPRDDVAVGVVLAFKDFLHNVPVEQSMGFPIFGMEKHEGYVAQDGVMAGEVLGKPAIVTANATPITVLHRADSVKGAVEGAYKRVKSINIPNSALYRNDIGHKVEEKIKTLHEFGYAEGWRHG
jgi:phosphoribosylamine---glycine ligase